MMSTSLSTNDSVFKKSDVQNADTNRTSEMGPLVGAIDQGTTSTRFIVFNKNGKIVAAAQRPVRLVRSELGWVEQDADEITNTVTECIEKVYKDLQKSGIEAAKEIKTIGITNQRETVVAWDGETGKALCNAISWLDTRNEKQVDQLLYQNEKISNLSGLRASTYFSAGKIKWLLEECKTIRERKRENGINGGSDSLIRFGNINSWILLNLTREYKTDITNAHRTGLFDFNTLDWSRELCDLYELPKSLSLPPISPCVSNFGIIKEGCLSGVSITGMLGDQHAALYGLECLKEGQAKITFGTGCFFMLNAGRAVPKPIDGLLRTIAYQCKGSDIPNYAIEASLACGGSTFEWAKEHMGILADISQLDEILANVEDSKGVLFIPNLSGSLAPFWNPKASACILGLRLFHNRTHLLLSMVEAIAFSCKQVVELCEKSAVAPIKEIFVDGGLANSKILIQTIANVLERPIIRPSSSIEATAFGAAKVAAIGAGINNWPSDDSHEKDDFYTATPNLQELPKLRQTYDSWLKAATTAAASI